MLLTTYSALHALHSAQVAVTPTGKAAWGKPQVRDTEGNTTYVERPLLTEHPDGSYTVPASYWLARVQAVPQSR